LNKDALITPHSAIKNYLCNFADRQEKRVTINIIVDVCMKWLVNLQIFHVLRSWTNLYLLSSISVH